MDDDWQGALDMCDMQDRKDAVKFWEKEKARLLADLEREDGDSRGEDLDRGDDR